MAAVALLHRLRSTYFGHKGSLSGLLAHNQPDACALETSSATHPRPAVVLLSNPSLYLGFVAADFVYR